MLPFCMDSTDILKSQRKIGQRERHETKAGQEGAEGQQEHMKKKVELS